MEEYAKDTIICMYCLEPEIIESNPFVYPCACKQPKHLNCLRDKLNTAFTRKCEICKKAINQETMSKILKYGEKYKIILNKKILVYQGSFKNKKYESYGKQYNILNRLIYEGKFHKGKYDGHGTLYGYFGKKIYEGSFKKGQYNTKNGKLYKKQKLYYHGAFENGHFEGKGKIFYDDEKTIKYSGEFSNGKFDGYGKLYRKDGTLIYQGRFKNEKYHGIGKLMDEYGNQCFTGKFKNGRKIEQLVIQQPMEYNTIQPIELSEQNKTEISESTPLIFHN